MSVFVDTGAWFSSAVASDPHHKTIASWLQANPLPLITTDYVVDETLTLLRARGENDKAIVLGRKLLDLEIANVVLLSPDDLRRAWELFRDQPQRHWSFTDCTSFVVMKRLHIHRALTFDRHFREFDATEVVP